MPLNISIENGVNGSGNLTDDQTSPSGFTLVGETNGITPSIKVLEELDEAELVRQVHMNCDDLSVHRLTPFKVGESPRSAQGRKSNQRWR
jgi:hypothetical protein